MTAREMLATAAQYLGTTGRPNVLTRRYAARHGDEYMRAPWCNISITEWARQSGNGRAVLPDGDRAYTVWHAEDGRELGRWYPGTATAIRDHAEPGAIVFFDWDGSNTIGRIDHVGIVERNLGDGRVATIEGNTGDACKRRVRGSSVIAGFWNPPYEEEDDVSAEDVLHGKHIVMNKGEDSEKKVSLASFLQEIETEQDRTQQRLDRIEAKQDAILAKLDQLGK